MRFEWLRRLPWPMEAERDEGFRQDILRLSFNGLRAIAAITAGAAFVLMVGWWLMFPQAASTPIRIWTDVVIVGIGLAEYLLTRLSWTYSRARPLAMLLVQITAAFLILSSLYLSAVEPAADSFIPSQMALAVLITLVALPLRPFETFGHCLAVAAIYWGATELASRTFLPGAVAEPEYFLFMAMMTLLATGLSAVLYSERYRAYRSYLQTLQAVGDLRHAQSRLALSESASSMARLAAAISHELNTPIGALKSAVDTLLLLTSRQATAAPEQLPRLLKLQAELRKSIQDSAGRLEQIAARVARFTNLDQADLQIAQINDLLVDVTQLLRSKVKTGTELSLDLSPLPPVTVNAQQVSAVFYDLIHNSIAALDAGGRVDVRTLARDGRIEVAIDDTGRGIDGARLSAIFDPGFEVTAGRVASGNWSMFNARQVMREHGGEVAISSEPGKGTRVLVTLPLR
jgi:signal transduction histidine kinase